MTTKINKPKSKYKKVSFNDPFIYVIDGALSKKFCKKVIEKFNNDDNTYRGITARGHSKNVKRSLDLCISSLENWKKEDNIFYESLHKNYNNYLEHLNKHLKGVAFCPNNLIDTGYQIQRTDPGEFYVFHHDFNRDTIRYFTFIWYLNDVEHDVYTEFIDGTRVQPKAGRFLMFPSTWTYIHRGYPPKNEVKYICTGWMSVNNEK